MQKSPPPFIWACPEEKNILDCESRCNDLLPSEVLTWTRRALHHRQYTPLRLGKVQELILCSAGPLTPHTKAENTMDSFGSPQIIVSCL